MRQSLSLSRPATVKLLHVTLRTLHNWETGKVRIPYSAYKLIRLFNSYEIFHPIWKDWRISGSRLITPEGHAFEASNFHWLSLTVRRADAFTKLSRKMNTSREADCHALRATAPREPDISQDFVAIPIIKNQAFSTCFTGLVYSSTSQNFFSQNQQIQGFQNGLVPPLCNTGGKTQPRASQNQQKAVVGGAL